MEKERIRRLSSQEHFEHMASRRKSSASASSGSPLSSPRRASVYFSSPSDDLSEIPVVHSPASKLLVDEHTEWRCFISSGNPEQEKDNLRGSVLYSPVLSQWAACMYTCILT